MGGKSSYDKSELKGRVSPDLGEPQNAVNGATFLQQFYSV